MNNVEITMRDLTDTINQIKESTQSPKIMRRSFSGFIDLSQKLTSCMRKEYSGKWEASNFQGWNDYTNIIKKLRNYDQHEDIIRTEVEESTRHTLPADDGWPELNLMIRGTMKQVDQLSDTPPSSGIKIMAADPVTGKMTNNEIGAITSRNHKLMLNISDESKRGRSINRMLVQLHNPGVITLASEAYLVYENYYNYYQSAKTEI